jgi:hypothetical protein
VQPSLIIPLAEKPVKHPVPELQQRRWLGVSAHVAAADGQSKCQPSGGGCAVLSAAEGILVAVLHLATTRCMITPKQIYIRESILRMCQSLCGPGL